MVPGAGLAPSRVSIAIPSALVVSAAVGEELIYQPTTQRENVSRATQQKSFPSRVRCAVRSVTHNRFGS